jgi:hypothetical protein
VTFGVGDDQHRADPRPGAAEREAGLEPPRGAAVDPGRDHIAGRRRRRLVGGNAEATEAVREPLDGRDVAGRASGPMRETAAYEVVASRSAKVS